MRPAQADTDGKPLLTLKTILLKAETQRICCHHEQARILFEKAYAHAHLMYGPTHPILLEISERIVDTYHALGKYCKSSEKKKVHIDALSRYFGKGHPRTLEAIERLAERS
jgi:hypothetical protein